MLVGGGKQEKKLEKEGYTNIQCGRGKRQIDIFCVICTAFCILVADTSRDFQAMMQKHIVELRRNETTV